MSKDRVPLPLEYFTAWGRSAQVIGPGERLFRVETPVRKGN
jgi:hypothetical protein